MVHPNMSLLYFTFRLLASKKGNCYVDVLHVAILEKNNIYKIHDFIILDATLFVVGVKLFFGSVGFCFIRLNCDMLLKRLAKTYRNSFDFCIEYS